MSPPQPQDIEDAFLFHFLATEPEKVLPAGKSLLSLISQRQPKSQSSRTNDIQTQVEKVMHRAFWDGARETLSSPEPSVQIPRLKLLYSDLLQILSPLFPPDHHIITELSVPIPPTSSPLHSAVIVLEDILKSLRKRCAPVRDPDINLLLEPLQSVPPVSTLGSHGQPNVSLANLVVDTIQSIVSLAQALKEDLSNAVLARMNESQLSDFAKEQARAKEREIIFNWDTWNDQANGAIEGDRSRILQSQWAKWVNNVPPAEEDSGRERWIRRLMLALSLPTPVSCMPGDTNANPLPPQFFFLRPSLFYVQNQLQALVIAASLLALLKSSAPNKQTMVPDFMMRVWSLLKLEIDQETVPRHSEDTETKLVNLADEVIRARRMAFESTATEEVKIRAAVERTLRLDDPVFRLLQKRLVSFLEERLVSTYKPERDQGKDQGPHNIPKVMRTGRNLNTTTSSSLPLMSQPQISVKDVAIKGFEDDLLRENIVDVLGRITRCIEWLRYTWLDPTLI